ncbi:hypothetical protein [Pseudomonas sp. BP8]|uniref:hypothetical protein n=1 Tax=Pseudomonas sp. BP8 TaxID=2817864 RepID=UPI001AE31500|nr:hypothetical protein [Pseudomonas sp. BP8]MBP2263540.1 hypothetical protein [Pseudomonas sp. BP8]HDS1735205.1 hypothetical protein [Pseudomonas putida]
MSEKYNQMHEKLVRNKKDFVGMIAYSIYKTEKREAVKGGMDISAFTRIKSQQHEIKKYRAEADGLATLFLHATADEKLKGVQSRLADQINNLTLDSLPKSGMFKRLWKWHASGSAGIIGNFWTAVFVAVFVWAFSDPSIWGEAKDSALKTIASRVNGQPQAPSVSEAAALPAQ